MTQLVSHIWHPSQHLDSGDQVHLIGFEQGDLVLKLEMKEADDEEGEGEAEHQALHLLHLLLLLFLHHLTSGRPGDHQRVHSKHIIYLILFKCSPPQKYHQKRITKCFCRVHRGFPKCSTAGWSFGEYFCTLTSVTTPGTFSAKISWHSHPITLQTGCPFLK